MKDHFANSLVCAILSFMNTLHIYPTSRAIRAEIAAALENDAFLPAYMRMDEFEQRLVLLPGKQRVDAMQRMLLLREASAFEAFEGLKFDRKLVRFFGKGEAIFRFFEELSGEKVDFETLAQADAYAEFGEHLEILETLRENYRSILEARGLTDRCFIPENYQINSAFVQQYETIELHLEGYLSRFELELLEQVAKETTLLIHYRTSAFTKKMQERFAEMGIKLPDNSEVCFDLGRRTVVSQRTVGEKLSVSVKSVEEREAQVALALAQIEKMVQSGMDPEKIALVLPDESFKEHFMLFDRLGNLNFAMGYDYRGGSVYKKSDALFRYLQTGEQEYVSLLERYGMPKERYEGLNGAKKMNIAAFFETLNALELLERSKARIEELRNDFLGLFGGYEESLESWLFLWLKALSSVTTDDVRGGKVTVLGVLETRGVAFDGVVVVDFNENIVPATTTKDRFLNSSVRRFAGLPTKTDREALQKQFYMHLLESAKEAVLIYSSADDRLPSKFLYELGLEKAPCSSVPLQLLYSESSQLIAQSDPVVHGFDATKIAWSPSRLKTYLGCRRKYYYRYIEKIEAPKEEELNEGLFLHKVLDALFDSEDRYEEESQMQQKLEKLLYALHPLENTKASYQKLLWAQKLKPFVQKQVAHFRNGWRVVAREEEISGEIGGLRFKGRIDRLDQNETGTLVLDYKSGSTVEAQKIKNLETLSDFQMSIYHHLLAPRYQNLTLAFVKILEEGQVEEIKALEEKNEMLAKHIVALKQTESFVAQKCESLQICKYCEYALMCGRGEYL